MCLHIRKISATDICDGIDSTIKCPTNLNPSSGGESAAEVLNRASGDNQMNAYSNSHMLDTRQPNDVANSTQFMDKNKDSNSDTNLLTDDEMDKGASSWGYDKQPPARTHPSSTEPNSESSSSSDSATKFNILRDVSVSIPKITNKKLKRLQGVANEKGTEIKAISFETLENPILEHLKNSISDGEGSFKDWQECGLSPVKAPAVNATDEYANTDLRNAMKAVSKDVNPIWPSDAKVENSTISKEANVAGHESKSWTGPKHTYVPKTVTENVIKSLLENALVSETIKVTEKNVTKPVAECMTEKLPEIVIQNSPILTCQLASPDAAEATIGWSPPLNSASAVTAEDGQWKLTPPVKLNKSRSFCESHINSTNSFQPNQFRSYDSDSSIPDVDYKLLEPAVNLSSEDEDSDCVVEAHLNKSKDSLLLSAAPDTLLEENGEKISSSYYNSKTITTPQKRGYNDNKSRGTAKKIEEYSASNPFIDDRQDGNQNIDIATGNEEIEQWKKSYGKEFEAEEDSSSENEDEIDADEMSKLKSRQRRSSRVARPVYDTFVDKKVSAS